MASLQDFLEMFGEVAMQQQDPEIIAEPPRELGSTEALEQLLSLSEAAPEDVFVARGDTVTRGDLPTKANGLPERSKGTFSRAAEGSSDRAYLNITPGGNERFDFYRAKGFSDDEALALAVDAVQEQERAALEREALLKEELGLKKTVANREGDQKDRALDIEEFIKKGTLDLEDRKLGVQADEAKAERQLKELLARLEIGEEGRQFDKKTELANSDLLTGLSKLSNRIQKGQRFTNPRLEPRSIMNLLTGGDISTFKANKDDVAILAQELGPENAALLDRIITALEKSSRGGRAADVNSIIASLLGGK